MSDPTIITFNLKAYKYSVSLTDKYYIYPNEEVVADGYIIKPSAIILFSKAANEKFEAITDSRFREFEKYHVTEDRNIDGIGTCPRGPPGTTYYTPFDLKIKADVTNSDIITIIDINAA